MKIYSEICFENTPSIWRNSLLVFFCFFLHLQPRLTAFCRSRLFSLKINLFSTASRPQRDKFPWKEAGTPSECAGLRKAENPPGYTKMCFEKKQLDFIRPCIMKKFNVYLRFRKILHLIVSKVQEKKYPETQKFNIPQTEENILKFWEENNIFEKSLENRKANKPFVFYEGPPSANGRPGIHHVMARTIKDLVCRYKSLRGYYVPRKAGWDTHGLPVEIQVEKKLGITKKDIGTKISIEEYNRECRKTVMQYKEEWDELTRRMGYWIDLENPYITFTNEYIESVWFLLKNFYEKGLLYKGYTIQPYSPGAGTGLSSHELNLPGCYRPVKDISMVAQFKVVKNEKSEFLFKNNDADVYFLAWTTTPWTLPSNCALTLGKNIDYALVHTLNKYTGKPVNVILAKETLKNYFDKEAENQDFANYETGKNQAVPWKIIGEYKGKDLLGIKYEPLFSYVSDKELQEKAYKVIDGDFVSTEEGTGIVHTASLFGADDFAVCKKHNIPSVLVKDEEGNRVPLVNKEGRFRPEVTDFAGRGVKPEFDPEEIRNQKDYKPTDLLIALKLKEEGKAFSINKYEHNYPHCWRTDKPVIYYPLDSWFVKVTAVKEDLTRLNETINWQPPSTGQGRFGNWLKNASDWNLSRSRYWGIPLPIWVNEDKTEYKCIGSIKELYKEIEKAVSVGVMQENPLESLEELDLHRPYIDRVVLADSQGKPMYRESDLIDVWFDSGAMPYAQWHYPFENTELFEKNFPADFISEGVDQTRGWFYTLHVIATIFKKSVAYKNVISTGLVLDKNGNKMSKRLGNAVDPFTTINKYGVDPLRWYMITHAPPWDNLKFNFQELEDTKRKFFGTLQNTYNFFALYANIDNFFYSASEKIPVENRTELDRWVLSKLNNLIAFVTEKMDAYDPTPAARAIQNFLIEDVSNWYVRLSRRRFWKSDWAKDKIAAFQTLYEVLHTLSLLTAPYIPFIAEWLYKNLTDFRTNPTENSVHLQDFPQTNSEEINKELEEKIDLARRVVYLVRSLRKQEKIRIRQPLKQVLVAALDNKTQQYLRETEEIIKAEVNVKNVALLPADSDIIVKEVKPNYRVLGPKLGKKIKIIGKLFKELSQEEIKKLEQEGKLEFEIDGEKVVISIDETEIISKDIPGWKVASDGKITLALDVEITEDLKSEGLARDFVNRIQNLRKEIGLEVTDRIQIFLPEEEVLREIIARHKDYISREVLANDIKFVDKNQEFPYTFELDGKNYYLNLLKA